MASSAVVKDRQPLKEKDIVCLGHLKRVFPLLDKLHDVGCGRDKAQNRELFFDDYVKLVLLYIWNPLIESARDLQEAVGLPRRSAAGDCTLSSTWKRSVPIASTARVPATAGRTAKATSCVGPWRRAAATSATEARVPADTSAGALQRPLPV